MPRPKTKESKATPHSSKYRPPPHEAPPSSKMPHMIPPISTLAPDNDDRDEASELLNQNFPLSSARDEPGTQPLMEHFVFVSIPSPPPTPPPNTRGKKSRSRRSGKPVASNNTQGPSARPLQDQENIPHNPSPTSQVVPAKVKTKRGKIQVQKSYRVLRPRGCQLSVVPEEVPLDGSLTCPSALRLTQDKENNETPYWEASWDRWTHVRGTIRRKK